MIFPQFQQGYFWGGGEGTSVEILSKFSNFVEIFLNLTNFLTQYQGYWREGRSPHLGRCISKFLEVGRCIFPQNGYFFEIFEMYLPTTPQKSLFIAFLLTNFPKISKKVLKNFQISKKVHKIFFRRLRCRENPPFSNFCPFGR